MMENRGEHNENTFLGGQNHIHTLGSRTTRSHAWEPRSGPPVYGNQARLWPEVDGDQVDLSHRADEIKPRVYGNEAHVEPQVHGSQAHVQVQHGASFPEAPNCEWPFVDRTLDDAWCKYSTVHTQPNSFHLPLYYLSYVIYCTYIRRYRSSKEKQTESTEKTDVNGEQAV